MKIISWDVDGFGRMRRMFLKKAYQFSFVVIVLVIFSVGVVYDRHSVFASAPPSSPPPDIIQSADGNVKIGVSRQFGGAIVYLKDNRIPDTSVANGNIIDYS